MRGSLYSLLFLWRLYSGAYWAGSSACVSSPTYGLIPFSTCSGLVRSRVWWGWRFFLVAVAGLLVFPKKRWQGLLLGLLAGYFLYGFTLSYHIATHDYYQMPLLAVAALGLAAVFDFIIRAAAEKERIYHRFFCPGVGGVSCC